MQGSRATWVQLGRRQESPGLAGGAQGPSAAPAPDSRLPDSCSPSPPPQLYSGAPAADSGPRKGSHCSRPDWRGSSPSHPPSRP